MVFIILFLLLSSYFGREHDCKVKISIRGVLWIGDGLTIRNFRKWKLKIKNSKLKNQTRDCGTGGQ